MEEVKKLMRKHERAYQRVWSMGMQGCKDGKEARAFGDALMKYVDLERELMKIENQ